MSQTDEFGHQAMQNAIDGLQSEVAHSRSTLAGHRASTQDAARDLVRLIDATKPLLLRAHAALMVDERNKRLVDEMIEATLDMEEARGKWEAVLEDL